MSSGGSHRRPCLLDAAVCLDASPILRSCLAACRLPLRASARASTPLRPVIGIGACATAVPLLLAPRPAPYDTPGGEVSCFHVAPFVSARRGMVFCSRFSSALSSHPACPPRLPIPVNTVVASPSVGSDCGDGVGSRNYLLGYPIRSSAPFMLSPLFDTNGRGGFVRHCLVWSSYFGALFGAIASRCGGRRLVPCLLAPAMLFVSARRDIMPLPLSPPIISSSFSHPACLPRPSISESIGMGRLCGGCLLLGSVACPHGRLVLLILPAPYDTRGGEGDGASFACLPGRSCSRRSCLSLRLRRAIVD